MKNCPHKNLFSAALILLLSACGSEASSANQISKPIHLPPHPSAERQAPDFDKNGMREDVAQWIASQPYTPLQKKAAAQLAKAWQKALSIDIRNEDSLYTVGLEAYNAMDCVFARFSFEQTPTAHEVMRAVEKATANTDERTIRYLAYNQALTRTTIDITPGDQCR